MIPTVKANAKEVKARASFPSRECWKLCPPVPNAVSKFAQPSWKERAHTVGGQASIPLPFTSFFVAHHCRCNHTRGGARGTRGGAIVTNTKLCASAMLAQELHPFVYYYHSTYLELCCKLYSSKHGGRQRVRTRPTLVTPQKKNARLLALQLQYCSTSYRHIPSFPFFHGDEFIACSSQPAGHKRKQAAKNVLRFRHTRTHILKPPAHWCLSRTESKS